MMKYSQTNNISRYIAALQGLTFQCFMADIKGSDVGHAYPSIIANDLLPIQSTNVMLQACICQ